ncbi:MAG: DUF1559 domain-containing protein, partial [Pirellulaceae bacterium]
SDPESDKVQWTHENRIVTTTNYLGVNGTDYKKRDGVFYLNSATKFRDILDGQSNTLMVGERPPSPDFWYGWWYAGFGQSGSGSPDMLLGVREVHDPPPPGVTNYLETCPPGPYQFTKGKHGNATHCTFGATIPAAEILSSATAASASSPTPPTTSCPNSRPVAAKKFFNRPLNNHFE